MSCRVSQICDILERAARREKRKKQAEFSEMIGIASGWHWMLEDP